MGSARALSRARVVSVQPVRAARCVRPRRGAVLPRLAGAACCCRFPPRTRAAARAAALALARRRSVCPLTGWRPFWTCQSQRRTRRSSPPLRRAQGAGGGPSAPAITSPPPSLPAAWRSPGARIAPNPHRPPLYRPRAPPRTGRLLARARILLALLLAVRAPPELGSLVCARMCVCGAGGGGRGRRVALRITPPPCTPAPTAPCWRVGCVRCCWCSSRGGGGEWEARVVRAQIQRARMATWRGRGRRQSVAVPGLLLHAVLDSHCASACRHRAAGGLAS